MRKSTENQAKFGNEDQVEPSANKNRSDNRITNIADLNNDTTVEVFKYLKYCGLAKASLVSKRFSNLIRTHRHTLARVYVYYIGMDKDCRDPTDIKIFNKTFSPEQYNNWVICYQYSKKLPPETQIARMQCTQSERKVYRLYAYVDYYYKDSEPSGHQTDVFDARIELSHENWPVFQHFFRLLTDPFVYIRHIYIQNELISQNDALNLLACAINPDYGRIQCHSLNVSLEDNIQNHINWIKGHVHCYKIDISNLSVLKHDDEFLDLFMTGANCTSAIHLRFGDHCKLIGRFVQKFMDLKGCDENEVVGSIDCSTKRNVNLDALKRDYADFVVEGNINEKLSYLVFEFVNNDIGKKLRLAISFYDQMYFRLKTSSL